MIFRNLDNFVISKDLAEDINYCDMQCQAYLASLSLSGQ